MLDLAEVKSAATKLVLTASDGFTSEVALADARKCADCLVAFAADGSFTSAMPGMASNTWVKNLVKIEAK